MAIIKTFNQISNGRPYKMSSRCPKMVIQSRLSLLNGKRVMAIKSEDSVLYCQTVRNHLLSSPKIRMRITCSDVICHSLSSGSTGQQLMATTFVSSISTTLTTQRLHKSNPLLDILLRQPAILKTKKRSSAFTVSRTYTNISTRSALWSGKPKPDHLQLY